MSEGIISLTSPLTDSVVEELNAGDSVYISGPLYTARDAAHKRFVETIQRGEKLPFELHGQIIYYVGPTPPKPGHSIGSAGPTTSSRMDPYVSPLIERGLKGMLGKGKRAETVIAAMIKHHCVYFGAVEGTAALIARCIKSCEVIAYEDLGPEAVHLLTVENLPAVVINDIRGRDLYQEGRRIYQRNKHFVGDLPTP
jgi:fumarate hydratase subunit beta